MFQFYLFFVPNANRNQDFIFILLNILSPKVEVFPQNCFLVIVGGFSVQLFIDQEI